MQTDLNGFPISGVEMVGKWHVLLVVLLCTAHASDARMTLQDEQKDLHFEDKFMKPYPANKYQAGERREEKWANQIRPPAKSKNTNLVLSLVSTILGAIQSEQCLERLLCELGWSLSEVEAARVVVQLAGVYVPPEHAHLLAALRDAVMRIASCSQYRCGKLPSRDEL